MIPYEYVKLLLLLLQTPTLCSLVYKFLGFRHPPPSLFLFPSLFISSIDILQALHALGNRGRIGLSLTEHPRAPPGIHKERVRLAYVFGRDFCSACKT